jgi:ribosomal protein L37AE/L43A
MRKCPRCDMKTFELIKNRIRYWYCMNCGYAVDLDF